MSSRESKSEALRRLREQRLNRQIQGKQSEGGSILANYSLKDEDDIFEQVDEETYHDLVEKRRQREDFVVDDDGLGYHDDGEEVVFRGAEHEDEFGKEKRKRSGKTASLTDDVLRKARKTNAMLREKEEMTKETGPMWNFVRAGADVANYKEQNEESSTGKKQLNTSNMQSVDLDALLDTLDDHETPSRSRKRSSLTISSRASALRNSSRRVYGHRASLSTTRPGKPTPTKRWRTSNSRQSIANEEMSFENNNDQHHTEIENYDKNAQDDRAEFSPARESQPTVTSNPMNAPTPDEDIPKDESKSIDAKSDSRTQGSLRKRLAFACKTSTKLSRPAMEAIGKKKMADLQAKSEPVRKQPNLPSNKSDTFQMNRDTNNIASEVDGAISASANTNLESILQKHIGKPSHDDKKKSDTESEDENPNHQYDYVDMFWIDAVENKGKIYLFGKVKVKAESNDRRTNNSPVSSSDTFVSCCAVVDNNLRSLFVLPRISEDGSTRVSMVDVHKEINSILKPSCIPNTDGSSWAGKIVKRKYAFKDPNIPRSETEYFKIIYDAKYKTPSPEICEGGNSYQCILGAGASVLENFIIKRKLMGPCWIRIKNPCAHSISVSWCKIEFRVNNPKDIVRLDLVDASLKYQAPPVKTVSFKLKTIVNPSTHKAEIVSLSAICHKETQLDTASDESLKFMTQLSLIRPLGDSIHADATIARQFPRDFDKVKSENMPQLQKMTNERALLSRFLAQIGNWDPDVLVGHNAFGYDLDIILNRCVDLKVPTWSKIGRRKKMQIPNRSTLKNKDNAISNAIVGRILCDTYLSSKELVWETTYSLTNLAATQLNAQRFEVEPADVPSWFQSTEHIVRLAQHTLNDAQLVQRLMFKLQILPLTKQLTCIAGNLWSKTIKGNRADRNEYLLLHEFHKSKYIVPEKRREGKAEKGKKFSGGLVLEPKKGLYNSFILLLDFNSLYPSIIQEYNLCFTTVEWSKHEAELNEDDQIDSSTNRLAPLPGETLSKGILPRVIKSLVERRKIVKKMVKNEKHQEKLKELDIRQKALKLTANSMYGCLGFSNSRFYAQPIAALVTAMGRETLQRTVDIAQDTCGLEVIYGDTDSIMINTHKNLTSDLSEVRGLGNQVKKEVNKLFKTLELEIDGIFRSMLLLKKKKYAAITVTENSDGTLTYDQEYKGLDLVRRDWCVQSKDTGHYVLDQILSQGDRELVVENIHSHLENLAQTMREGKLPLEKYIITKGLSKHPDDYPDGKSQPHVQVAKMMLKNNKTVNVNDHIPYIIIQADETPDDKSKNTKSKAVAERARHPEEIERSAGALKPDIDWYLAQQILPPISRLCEPIDGTSQNIIAQKLGLDSSKYKHVINKTIDEDNDLVNYVPASTLLDSERFKDVEKLYLQCSSCGERNEFRGVFDWDENSTKRSGLTCPNPKCTSPNFWGESNHVGCFARIYNELILIHRRQCQEYYSGVIKCEDPTCGLETRQLSVLGGVCLARGCTGRMGPKYSESTFHTQLKYLDTLFDINHASEQLEKNNEGSKKELMQSIAPLDKKAFGLLHELTQDLLDKNAYNWVAPSLWKSLFEPGNITALQ